MCGIVGLFDTQAFRSIDSNLLSRMNDLQTHRGPDASGLYVRPGIGLGHRRLSIIDLKGGKQPILDRAESIVLVFNGEIYNYKLLRDELKKLGHEFTTDSDTEVLLLAYKHWGKSCLARLRGMFAFAIWDAEQKNLFLARDRMGIKPLYYAFLPSGMFIFGSELKSLTIHPEFRQKMCPFAIADYFSYGYIPDPKTIYQGVYKLPPGHYIECTWGESRIQPQAYWDVKFDTPIERSIASLEEELLHNLDDAVKARMIADVPLGAFLSGGVDSSAVVASMSLQSTQPVKTCAIGFDDARFDESEYAHIVAKHCQTDHIEHIVKGHDSTLLGIMPTLFDEPFADSSAIPTYRVCEHTRQHVKVALSGDGGDEVFAGYRRYRGFMREESLRQMIPHQIRIPLFSLLATLYPKLDFAPRIFRAKSTFEVLAKETLMGYFHNIAIFKDGFRQRLFSHGFLNKIHGYHPVDVLRAHKERFNGDDLLSLVQYLDMKTYLPGDILTKVDRASMAHALEVRVPLLDHHFVEWSAGVTSSQKLRDNIGKYIFKSSLRSRLPKDILYRRKQGFAIPIASWLKSDLKNQLMSLNQNSEIMNTGFFDMKFIQTLIARHMRGVNDYSAMLWSICVFEQFLQHMNKNQQGITDDANLACA